MSKQPNQKLPKNAAQLVLWFKGLPQPTAFLVLRKKANRAVQSFKNGKNVTFLSYPNGRGVRSKSIFSINNLRGVTFKYPTIQLALVN